MTGIKRWYAPWLDIASGPVNGRNHMVFIMSVLLSSYILLDADVSLFIYCLFIFVLMILSARVIESREQYHDEHIVVTVA